MDTPARCPWCSAPLAGAATACSACGATVQPATGSDVPGVTTLDPDVLLRRRSEREPARQRAGLLGFLTGEVDLPETDPGDDSTAPPSDEVRREMLRMQLEAERADLEAQLLARRADAVLEGRAVLPPADDDAGAGPDAASDPDRA